MEFNIVDVLRKELTRGIPLDPMPEP